MAKFSFLREEAKRAWLELRGEDRSPARTAAAVAIGLFIGSQPIFGLHTPLVLLICLTLRLDAAICWVAANISNPFFAPALITLEVQVGAYLRTGSAVRFDVEASQLGIRELLVRYGAFAFVGAPAVGAALAAVGAALTFVGLVVKRRFAPGAPPVPYRLPEGAPPWLHAAERIATRYSTLGMVNTPAERTRFHYVRMKLLGDPVAKLVAGIAGDEAGALGAVVDVGTGRGQLPLLLLELGRATSAFGVDWDEAKVGAATRAAGARPDGPDGEPMPPLDATFVVGDARSSEIPPGDTVLLVDVLHYFAPEEQDAIVDRCAAAVRPGGRLLVRDADAERGWRSWATLAEERLFTFLRFNRGERVRFRPAREIVARLEERGLTARVEPAWGKTPFANVLIVAERAGATSHANT